MICHSTPSAYKQRGHSTPLFSAIIKEGNATSFFEMKQCKKCGESKSDEEFYKESRVKDGLQARCKDCCKSDARAVFVANPEPYRRRSRDKPPEERRADRLRLKYGLTLEDYDKLLLQQEGKCAICQTAQSGHNMTDELLVDHCHTTNKVRGLLCCSCNLMIGKSQDNPDVLKAAAAYLEINNVDLPQYA